MKGVLAVQGDYAVIDQHLLMRLSPSVPRGPSRCECGGPDPLERTLRDRDHIRVVGDRRALPAPIGMICGHNTIALVRQADLPVVNGTFRVSVPEYPAVCPRCRRAQSAVVLFTSVECKHGCYAKTP